MNNQVIYLNACLRNVALLCPHWEHTEHEKATVLPGNSDSQQAKLSTHVNKWHRYSSYVPGETFPQNMSNFNIAMWTMSHSSLQYEYKPYICVGRSDFPGRTMCLFEALWFQRPWTSVGEEHTHLNTNSLHGPWSELYNSLGLHSHLNCQ